MTTNGKKWDAIVVGGGAAGMMAAGRAAERGKRVLLLEKNKTLGQKLKISGGGRCNITNAEFDEHIFLKNYGKAASFLYSPFSQFGVQETFDFFESRGLPLIIEDKKRAFPKTEKALDVCLTLERYVREGGCEIRMGSPISRIIHTDTHVTGVIADGHEYSADAVIIATGGASHPETGSTGDGFEWLRELGHTVHAPTPTIVPMATLEELGHALAGVSIPLAKVTFFVDGKKQCSKKGPLLFTHFGISGPVVLNSSGAVGGLLSEGTVTVIIDVTPDKDERVLDEAMVALFDANKNKELKSVFSGIAPLQLLSQMPGLSGDSKVHSVTKEHRKMIIRTLKSLTFTISGLMGLDRAVVVDGGVELSEIQNKTMRSIRYNNLYVVGDLLHINRPSGGYSLQLCWTSGYVAGSSV
ncbi:MAG: aminoacetone oxidase family FAD-binding enzyme [bacterium]|nr:aminoacetone oxidase family FAD-binding enzyme [bacterium]